MDSCHLFNFALKRDYEFEGKPLMRIYQLSLQPGSPWDEILGVLEEYKKEFELLKAQAEALEASKKAAEKPVDAEIVQ